ncbi:MAG: radical SAM protein [Candidatus Riflebacteria bacterium]|nr:radical SAM protein [Candidatus Riflebacteria bacterium]
MSVRERSADSGTDAGKLRRSYMECFLADHCNLSCAHCSHASPYMAPSTPDPEEFARDLASLAGVLHTGRLRLLGGEPLLNRDILEFVRAIRASGICDQIGLSTNGVLLDRVAPELFDEIDYLDVSLYPGTKPDADTIARTAEQIGQGHGLRLNVFRKPEFRFQSLDFPIASDETVRRIYQACKMAHGGWDMFHDGCHTFHEGWYYRCNRPVYSRRYLHRRGVPPDTIPDFAHVDGVPLHEPGLRERLGAYLLSEEPLRSCRFCVG